MDPFVGIGYIVFMDNYYSSPYLFYNLRLNDTSACGTVDLRKGIPKEFATSKFKTRNDMKVKSYNNEMVALRILDRKHVTLISTVYDTSIVQTWSPTLERKNSNREA